LVHKRERDRLLGAVQRDGVTLVPLSIYFNDRGIAKVDLGVARGKRKYDKRETQKKRDWDRQKARLLRENR
jgi:SsrA-binding protein